MVADKCIIKCHFFFFNMKNKKQACDLQKKKKKSVKSKILNKKKTCDKYTKDELKAAVKAVKDNEMTLINAAEKYHIPRSTLHDKVTGKSTLDAKKGPATYLTATEEEEIVNWIIECSQRGFPVTKIRLIECVQKFIKKSGRETPFTEDRPGKKWLKLFMNRHPILSRRIPQNLTCIRASVSEEKVRQWFDEVKTYLLKKNLLNIGANRVFNLDESAFKIVPKTDKVIVQKGARAVYQIVSSSEKATVTVLFTASASGDMAPPLVLLEQKKSIRRQALKQIPAGWGVGQTESGWMTGESFYSFIKNIFYPYLVTNNIEFPVLLYVDNHASHVNSELIEFCKEKNIELVALYPNSTHLIQPLDVALFHPLKEAYKKEVVHYKIENEIADFKKNMVATVLKRALDKMDFSRGIINGFRASGLYPLNPDAVDYNVLNKKKKKKQNKELIPESNSPLNDNCTEADRFNKKKEFLTFFETEMLTKEVLQIFLEHEEEEVWSGPKSYEEQFQSWRQLRRSVNSN